MHKLKNDFISKFMLSYSVLVSATGLLAQMKKLNKWDLRVLFDACACGMDLLNDIPFYWDIQLIFVGPSFCEVTSCQIVQWQPPWWWESYTSDICGGDHPITFQFEDL